MVTDPNTLLSVYAALAENVYRRDSNNDQALSIPEIGELTGVSLAVEPLSAEVTVFGQDGQSLGNLQTNGDYYYSERGFVGMIVQVEGKYVVVFRGTDTTLSGWSSVRAAVARDDTDSYTPNVIARPRRCRGDPGNRRRVPDDAGLPRRLRLLAMTG